MAVTGGIKFFDLNLADSKTGTTAPSASSGLPSAPFILDRNYYTYWRSVGSDDTTWEDVVIDFPAAVSFNRVFLIGHNFKEFYLERWTGSFWSNDFGTVVGVNGETPDGPASTRYNDYSRNTAYYEINYLGGSITTSSLKINVRKTQVADEEKFLNSLVVTNELGTLAGFPIIVDATKDKKIRKATLLNGRTFTEKSLEVFRTRLDFKNYPPGLEDDLDLVYSLFDRDEDFYIWLCGGRAGEPYFKYTLRGWRLEDLPLVQTVNIFKDKYRRNIYTSMVDLKMNLEEAG
jgi:hypothetical protein